MRVRTRRGAFRIQVGVAKGRAELAALKVRAAVLRRLFDRGETEVLEAIQKRRVSAAEVERLVDLHGIADFRAHLDLEAVEGNVPTLDAYSVVWLETIKKAGTKLAYRKALPHLTGYVVDGQRLGDRPWHKVARHTIRDVKASLPHASNTVRLFMGAWSSFFSWAIEREQSEAEEQGRAPLIQANPVQQAKAWTSIERTRHRFLTWAEFTHLLETCPEPMRAQYATLGLAGLRIEELLHLPPAHVHLPTHLHIGPWGEWAPKGYPRYKHGVRDVPLHREVLVPLLERYAATWAGSGTFFVNPNDGKPWSYAAFTDRMKKDLPAAGLIYGQYTKPEGKLERTHEGITPHTFRHTLASWMAQRDVQLMKIAMVLGDTEETIRLHYAHLLPTDLDQSVNRVGLSGRLDDLAKTDA